MNAQEARANNQHAVGIPDASCVSRDTGRVTTSTTGTLGGSDPARVRPIRIEILVDSTGFDDAVRRYRQHLRRMRAQTRRLDKEIARLRHSPRPLMIDGHAYHRRRRNRRRSR